MNKNFVLVIIGIILLCCSCGNIKEHEDALIVSELQSFGTDVLQDKTVTDVKVLRKQLLEESNQQIVYCIVVYKNEKMEYRRNATLNYIYYDEGGWNLESLEFDKEMEVLPVAEPSPDDINRALQNVEGGSFLSSEYTIKNSSIDLDGKSAEYEVELNSKYEKYHVLSSYKLSFFFSSEETARSLAGWRAGDVKRLEENVSIIDMDKWSDQDWFEWSYWRGFVTHTLEVEDGGDSYNMRLIIENDDEIFFSGQMEIEKEGHIRDDEGNTVLEFLDVSEETEYPSLRITIKTDNTVVLELCRSDGSWY